MDHFVYFYAIFVIAVIGIILILMLVIGLKNRQGGKAKPVAPKSHPAKEVLNRLGHEEDSPASSKPKSPNLMKSTAQEENNSSASIPSPTFAGTSGAPEPIVITQSATESPEYLDLKTKYERLEALFQEKSQELQKKEHELANELKIRKDFNKVKDLLEKELKDLKDKNHKLSLDVSATQMESENQKKRSLQLEEKNSKKDKELLAREHRINELTKELSNLTGKLPPTGPPAPSESLEKPNNEQSPSADQSPAVEKDPAPESEKVHLTALDPKPQEIAPPASRSDSAAPEPESSQPQGPVTHEANPS